MNKKNLVLTFGGIIATALAATPIVFAESNPFGMKELGAASVLAEAGQAGVEKAKEGKCGEGKCGAEKAKKQAAASAAKMAEGKCGAGKMGDDKANGTDKMNEGGESKE